MCFQSHHLRCWSELLDIVSWEGASMAVLCTSPPLAVLLYDCNNITFIERQVFSNVRCVRKQCHTCFYNKTDL